ncbi:MAG TPA: DAK2 domain-containing protein [Motilibacteraceae bacterium]|nr:DAK2 domain-containing protein [Motilibacteraceae bacterium]
MLDALDTLDAQAVRRWCRDGLESLARAREEIDALNVYPVPDGDTGTNLYLTVDAAAQALDALPADAGLAETLQTMARGALLGARGNSGIILSQLLRGVATGLSAGPRTGDGERAGGAERLAAALRRAAELGYEAVARPVEGTMLTVARAAAEGARGGTLAEVVGAAADAAREALARTPEQLEVLRLAGVVDAGGRGLTVLLDALVGVVTGVAVTGGPPAARPDHPRPPQQTADGPAFEVMYLLDAPDDAVEPLRAALEPLGDSLVVVGGDGLWNVHVHVDDVGAALEAGIDAGRPYRIKVTHFAEQAARAAGQRAGRAVVAVVAGDGLAAVLEASGATVVPGGPGHRACTADILAGIRGTGAGEVVVLPNDADSRAVAEAAAEEARAEGRRVAVVPTVASVQALAAMAVHDPSRRFDDDVVAMTSAAGHTRHGAVTLAVKEAVTMAGPCRPGDVLGVVDGDFAIIGADLVRTACDVVDRMLGPAGELVTVVTGAGAPEGLAAAVVRHVEATRPDVDTVVYDGGQARYPLLLAVE